MAVVKPLSKETSVKIINAIGRDSIINDFNVTSGAISQWKNRGLPLIRYILFKKKYPELKVWEEVNI